MEELHNQEILEKLEMMTQIVTGFTTVITQENEALKNGDIATVKSLYEQKVKAVSAYRALTAFFIKNREEVAAFQSPVKETLKELSSNLNQQLKTNDLLLKTRMDAGKKVMNTFINIAKEANNSNATSYGAHGTYTPLDNNRNALAFNRTL